MTVDTRALAARSLAEVAMRGASLREVMERNAPKLRDPRDAALRIEAAKLAAKLRS